MIKPLVEDKELFSTGMRGEEARCRKALELANENNTVALISTGDSGIYGMAGLILQMQNDEEVEVIPGVTASSAAGSVIGAPLMHDNCNISLSDLMTPYDLIKKRVRNAADADMIISLYNPRSKGRPHYLREAIEIIKEYREMTPYDLIKKRVRNAADADMIISLYNPRSKGRPHYLREAIEIIKEYRELNTPVAVVRHALRDGQEYKLFTLENFDEEVVDMFSIVIVGNSQSFIKSGKFITPRGYDV